MRRAVAIWLAFESGKTVIGNNPWNLHSGAVCSAAKGYCPGQGTLSGQIGNRYAGPGDQNVAVFATLDAGAKANAQNLIRNSGSYGYGAVITGARAGDPLAFLTALQNSSWSSGHYGYSKLTTAFRGISSYNNALTLSMPTGSSVSGVPNAIAVVAPGGTSDKAVLAVAGAPATPTTLAAYLGVDPATPVTDAMIASAANKIATATGMFNRAYPVIYAEMALLLKNSPGITAGKFPLSLTATGTPPGTDPGAGLPGVIPPVITDAFTSFGKGAAFFLDGQNWTYLIALVVGIPLALIGFYLLAGVPTQGANA
jgi:hypothetical protein